MNIIELQERLKDLPEQSLMQEMQMPSGTAPQFLVLSELKRRKRMRDDYQRQQAQGMQTVAEEAITGAGAPAEGIMQMSQAMAPQSAIAQNTGVNDMMQQESVRAPQPEQPMMMADGGYVQRMRDGSFTGNQQQGYLMFLQEMNLADSPESQQMYMRMMERQQERGVSPQLFMPGMDRAPESVSLSDVSADVGAFLPGAEAAPPMMGMPPAMEAPSTDVVDFDASVTETPAAPPPSDPESYFDTMRRITGQAADAARGMGIGIPSMPDINLPSMPNISLPPRANVRDIQGVGEIELGGLGDINESEEDLSIERLIRDLGFDNAMEIVRQNQAIAGEREAAQAAEQAEQEAIRAAEAERMIDINELPETARKVTDDGQLITPTPTPPLTSDAETSGSGGAGGFGAIESRIARMLEERERSAQADKWLSLAQTGLALMASDQPTLGGAIGEAGLAGVGALQKARSQYDKDIMELLNMQAGVQRARTAGARAGSSTAAIDRAIDDARQELGTLNTEARSYRKIDVDQISGEARLVDLSPPGLRARIVAVEDRLAQLNTLRSGGAETAQFDATSQ